jgi:uracil-DNA glycosylase
MTAADLPAAFATLPPEWREVLAGWNEGDEQTIVEAVHRVSGDRPIGPPDPFRALRLVAPGAAKVVIFGQDPYPGPGQADGLAFSAPTSGRPSLRRIFDVLEADRPGWKRPRSGRLDAWARQGVLLLNPTLSVEIGRSNSHAACGWRSLTSRIAQSLTKMARPPVVMLWGGDAQSFWDAAVQDPARLTVLRTRHPSNDFMRGFMREGSHFAATGQAIDWWVLQD